MFSSQHFICNLARSFCVINEYQERIFAGRDFVTAFDKMISGILRPYRSKALVEAQELRQSGLGTMSSLQEAAKALATSTRTLQRRCETVLGKSPLSYFQDLRVERAQSLLHGSGLDVDAIAAEVGYNDGTTLRTLLRERLGRGVRELRANLR